MRLLLIPAVVLLTACASTQPDVSKSQAELASAANPPQQLTFSELGLRCAESECSASDLFPEGDFPPESDRCPLPTTIRMEKATYPEKLRREGITGDVVVAILIDRTGMAKSAQHLSTTNAELVRPALHAASLIQFSPLVCTTGTYEWVVHAPYKFRFR